MNIIYNLVATCSFIALTALGYAQESSKSIDSLKINQIQVLGTHNSYARPVDPRIFELAKPALTGMLQAIKSMPKEQREKFEEYHPNSMDLTEGLRYDHPPLTDQLDSGIRSLELDVYYDPTGGRFSNPASYRILREKGVKNLAYMDMTDLDKPGFKLLHMADFDFRTYHTTLKGALETLKAWSNQNPDHAPIFIMIEAKESNIPFFPGATEVLKFDEDAYAELDNVILKTLGRDKIIVPDDIRGNSKTLREAVLAKKWPTVAQARGKFIFLLLPTTGGMGEYGGPYVKSHPSLENRVMFVQSSPESDFGAFILLDNAIVRQTEIQRYVRDGYLVRTRSDIETYEAKVNDYTRAEAAFTSGAQVISTDFFRLPNTYGTPYRVILPNGKEMRANPVNGN